MHVCRSIFLIWGSTSISLHDLHFKKLLIYLILVLYAAPQFSLCLKQEVLASCLFKLGPRLLMSPALF